ncbi:MULTISPECIES: MarR family winged helix-turn-helix transcriptional regulator [Streptomyces]|uniref:MarR family winged helix-turn-helix transcriptional regulator n=1 Tax=Streptomyces TaxID=1883 RepID=UPI000F6EB8B8|nr:MarR family winged helix-turn-helix transcriptional regulator [Streptomyces sp. W1SF4]AZM90411.1 MarR family transcriptional regulator [Streptomyces sp. W1SF4]
MTTQTQRTAAPADPAATDEMLPSQPIGYWSGVAHRAVIGHIRDAMARVDVTQPQWWTLNRVQRADGPLPRETVLADLAESADTPHDVPRAVDQLIHRGWLDSYGNGELLTVTDTGREAIERIRELVTALRTEIHEGITDEEYVAALRVLRRMADNVRAAAR